MFNEINKRDLLERIEGQKRGLRRLSETIMETVFGPSTIEGRQEALLMHAQTQRLYTRLERVESKVSEYNVMIDEILTEFLHAQLFFNGRLTLLKLRTADEETR